MMKSLIRSILILLSVAALTTTIANADDTKPAASVIPTPTLPTQELISKSYVTFKSDSDITPVSPFITDAINQIIKPIEAKIYSLLQWQSSQREEFLVPSYERVQQFGKWAQDRSDKECYNTRAKVLIRDSVSPVIFAGDNACSVDKGEWHDPYGGKILTDAKAQIQIDHMVPLKNAYISGAHRWDYRARCLYANYLGVKFHLLSVDGDENQRKGDKTPEQYLPSEKSYVCSYLKNWLSVKILWGLEMTASEATAIKKIVTSEGCHVEEFVMSESEIQTQRQFAKDNADLCIDHAANP
jgi:hypothetical protein